ncbi:hypothetical protein RND81_03G097100 [Saponaria officinalis]|uniref:Uncharacterized protein n=1 Tax=Saponaria officinalis TaxID=3572 RepID=A0AAW1M565_SAPOF
MDELAKAMKVIRLKDEEYGQYLTAGDDQVSITLTKPTTEGYNPRNTEWRLQWLKSPKGLVGQVRLWSIYNKVLTFAEDPADYYLNTLTDALTQQSWPPSHGGEAASEWRFELRGRNNNVALVGDLFKKSKRYNESLVLNAKSPSIDKKSRFIFNSFFRKTLFKWLNCNSWLVEVVNDDPDRNNLTTSTVSEKISTSPEHQPLMQQRHVSTNKATITCLETSTPVNNGQASNIQYHETSVKQKTSTTPPEQPLVHSNYGAKSSNVGFLRDQFMNTLSRWQVGQVYLNVSPTPTGLHTNAGYKYAQYTNSGHNVNGSGVQKNGDVSLYSETNRSRDNNANFINYDYE